TYCFLFFFNHTATTAIYTLSLHDALPISPASARGQSSPRARRLSCWPRSSSGGWLENSTSARGCNLSQTSSSSASGWPRPSTFRSEEHTSELQSREISYAVFCLKKKNKEK